MLMTQLILCSGVNNYATRRAISLGDTVLPHGHDRAGGPPNNRVGGAAQEKVREPPAAVAADDDQIRAPIRGSVDDRLGRIAFDEQQLLGPKVIADRFGGRIEYAPPAV